MTLRPTEPDFGTVSADGSDSDYERNLRNFHRRRYDRKQYHDPDARFDSHEETSLVWQPEPYNTRATVVKLDEFDRHPLAAAAVQEAKLEGDRYRRISRRYAGLE